MSAVEVKQRKGEGFNGSEAKKLFFRKHCSASQPGETVFKPATSFKINKVGTAAAEERVVILDCKTVLVQT